jgi:hypothetical protein
MELKPCPFCGGKAIPVPLSLSHGYIACIGDCGIHTGHFWSEPMTAPKESRKPWHELAAAAWNRRTDNG